jgi:hypothetical protein
MYGAMARIWTRLALLFRTLEVVRYVSLGATQRALVRNLRSSYPKGRLKTREGRPVFTCDSTTETFEIDLNSGRTSYRKK